MNNEDYNLIKKEIITNKIYTIRGVQVMLDSDLAELYGYEVKKLNQQVKRNIERFPDDFMFQLTKEETKMLPRSQIVTLEGKGSNIKYARHVFTEQGVYMLATVLKSETAINQSILIMRAFKEMRHYISNNQNLFTNNELLRITQNEKEILKIKNTMVSKNEFYETMKEFIGPNRKEEYLFLNGEKFSADVAYNNIYKSALNTIYIIDNYIGLKTLIHLKDIDNSVNVTIFSDNIRKGLTLTEYQDFLNQYNINIDFKTTNNKYHDRYIVLDYNTSNEVVYHCGASSKDAGNKITSITKINDIDNYKNMINELLLNKSLILK